MSHSSHCLWALVALTVYCTVPTVVCCLLFYWYCLLWATESLRSERMWAQLSLWNVNIWMLCVPSARPPQPEEGLRKEGEGKASCQSGWDTESAEVLAETQAWGVGEPYTCNQEFLRCNFSDAFVVFLSVFNLDCVALLVSGYLFWRNISHLLPCHY